MASASDVSAAGSSTAGGATVDRDLAAQFRKRNSEQCNHIKDMVNGNLELQSMVLATIERYRSGQSNADGEVLNLAGKVSATKKRKVGESRDIDIALDAGRAFMQAIASTMRVAEVPAVAALRLV